MDTTTILPIPQERMKGNLTDPPKERMNAKELGARITHFGAHMKVQWGLVRIPLKETRHEIPYQCVLDLYQSVAPRTVGALYFGYGLDGARFVPVIDLLDPASQLIDNRVSYIYEGGTAFTAIGPADRDTLVQEYARNIRLRRQRTSEWSGLLPANDRYADPRGIWYRRTGKLDTLITDNSDPLSADTRYLVISCISAELEYDDFPRNAVEFVGEGMEFRHLLAIHVAMPVTKDGRAKLEDRLDEGPDTGSYAMKAMDLGNACPPNCPPGRP